MGAGTLASALLYVSAHAQISNKTSDVQAPAATDDHTLHVEAHRTTKAVHRALTATKGLASSNIAVLSKGDVVIFAGTVYASELSDRP